MREIKFRAYDTINKKWVDAFDKITVADEEDLYWSWMTGSSGDHLVLLNDVVPFVKIVQYTGLKDRNGREIWEGDRIEFTVFDRFDHDTQFTGVVKYIGSRFLLCQSWECEDFDEHHGPFDLDWVHAQDDEIEIIGNIYEHSHLIKE